MKLDREQRNRSLLLRLLGISAGSFAFGFALVPLYEVLCDITGVGNPKDLLRPSTAVIASPAKPDPERRVTVEFIADLPSVGSWEFSPVIHELEVQPGKLY